MHGFLLDGYHIYIKKKKTKSLCAHTYFFFHIFHFISFCLVIGHVDMASISIKRKNDQNKMGIALISHYWLKANIFLLIKKFNCKTENWISFFRQRCLKYFFFFCSIFLFNFNSTICDNVIGLSMLKHLQQFSFLCAHT